MKFVQYTHKDKPNELKVGYMDGTCVVDIRARDRCVPKTLLGCLQQDEEFWEDFYALLDRVPYCSTPFKDICLKAPIHGMDKIICCGNNYTDYCEMHKQTVTPIPILSSKYPSTIIGPNDSLTIRQGIAKQVDWGVSLCAVIGKTATIVKAEEAYKYVFGFTIAQDIISKEWQTYQNGGQYLLAQSMDTFCPIGPWIVTLDEVGDPDNLDISCKMNGVYKQYSNTKNIIHKLSQVIERLSMLMTLFPGDIILTGTPAGVGMFANPPEFLQPGDFIRSEIQKIGVLETTVEEYKVPVDEFDLPIQKFKTRRFSDVYKTRFI